MPSVLQVFHAPLVEPMWRVDLFSKEKGAEKNPDCYWVSSGSPCSPLLLILSAPLVCVLTKCTIAKCSEIVTCLRWYRRSAFVWCHHWTGWFLCIPPIDTVWKTGVWISLCKNNINRVNAFVNGRTVARTKTCWQIPIMLLPIRIYSAALLKPPTNVYSHW